MIIKPNKKLQIPRRGNKVSEYYLNLDKHYPFFKLFDLTNSEYLLKISGSHIYNLFMTGKSTDIENYNKQHLLAFLGDKRSNEMCYYAMGHYRMSQREEELTNFSSLKQRTDIIDRSVVYSTYTMSINNEFLFLLCIKPEYIYYVKLCILLDQEIEFDCFYMLVKKGGETIPQHRNEIRMYNIIKKAIKDYGCNIIYVDSIENEINMSVKLPKFNTMKDYNDWLVKMRDDFLNSVKKKYDVIEHIEYPF